jgi:hypothetical protein
MRTLSRTLSLISLLSSLVAPSLASAAPTVCVPPKATAEQVKSPDGKLLVYAQETPAKLDDTATGPVPHQALCLIRDGAPPRLLLEGRALSAHGEASETLASFSNLLLSSDLSTLYFVSAGWVTAGAAHVVDLKTGKERFLVDGAVEEAPSSGPFKGKLVVVSMRLDPEHSVESAQYRGRIEVWTVVDRQGHTVRRLPEDEKARDALIRGR